MVLLDEGSLVRSADLILRGAVLSSESVYGSPHRPVVTVVAIEVTEALKGEVSGPVTHVTFPGGTLDGKTLWIPGHPHFHAGEDVCLFLKRLPGGVLGVLGMGQGKYVLQEDPDSGLVLAGRPFSLAGSHVLPQPGRTVEQVTSEVLPRLEYWDTLRRRILETVAEEVEP